MHYKTSGKKLNTSTTRGKERYGSCQESKNDSISRGAVFSRPCKPRALVSTCNSPCQGEGCQPGSGSYAFANKLSAHEVWSVFRPESLWFSRSQARSRPTNSSLKLLWFEPHITCLVLACDWTPCISLVIQVLHTCVFYSHPSTLHYHNCNCLYMLRPIED